MIENNKLKKLDFNINDVVEVYSGPVGILWEMLMGEQIHVGSEHETDILAKKTGIKKDDLVLDVCSALGGPARYLAKNYGCKVTGLDATKKMITEAEKRTKKEPYSKLIDYKLGNALDMPFKSETFDVVWGQDAWCYITDKNRLISEGSRVLKKGGSIAFTDWVQVGDINEKQWIDLNSFMVFPYIETIDGYEKILKLNGFKIILKDDETKDFAKHCHLYQKMLREVLKNNIIKNFGIELFNAADDGLNLWVEAADSGKVGRGRIIAKKN